MESDNYKEEWLSDDDINENDSEEQNTVNERTDSDVTIESTSVPFKVFSYAAPERKKTKTRNWNRNATLKLIELYGRYKHKIDRWRYIGKELRKAGFNVSDTSSHNRFKYIRRQLYNKESCSDYNNDLLAVLQDDENHESGTTNSVQEVQHDIKNRTSSSNRLFTSDPPPLVSIKDPLSIVSKEPSGLKRAGAVEFTVIKPKEKNSRSSIANPGIRPSPIPERNIHLRRETQIPNDLKRSAYHVQSITSPNVMRTTRLEALITRWTHEYRKDAIEREKQRERRHQQMMAMHRETHAMFAEIVTKLIDKIKK